MPYQGLDTVTMQNIAKNTKKTQKNEQLGIILKYVRLQNCLTQKQMARLLKMPYQNYQRYEYGIYKPKPSRLKEFCDLFRIETSMLVKEFYI